VAQAVSVLGDGASADLAGRLAEIEPERVPGAVEALDSADILRSDGVEFVHPVVRAAVYSRLSPADRAERHRHAARLLADSGADEDAVALHLMPARPAADEWVVDTLRRAARRAHSRGAPDVAAKYLLRGLTEPPPDERRPEMLVDLGLAELAVNEIGGLGRLREALVLSEDPRVRGPLALQLGRSLFLWADFAGAAEVFEAALAELPGGPSELRERLEAHLISTCFIAPALRARVAPRLVELLRDTSGVADPVLVGTLATAGVLMVGPSAGGVELAERALADPGLSIEADPTVLAMAAFALMAGGRLQTIERIWNATIAEARSHGALYATGFGLTQRAYVRMRLGAIASAEADARSALGGLPEGSAAQVRWIAPPLIDALVERGEHEEASGLLDDLRDHLLPLHDAPESLFLLSSMGRLRAAQRRHDEAVEHLRDCGRRLDDWGMRNPGFVAWRSELAAVLAVTGEAEEGRELAEEAIALAREFEVPRELGMALRAAALAQGGESGIELFREAVGVLAGSGAQLEHARAQVDLGSALRRAGQRSAARDELRKGLDQAQRLGAAALAAQAHEDLIAAGAKPRRRLLSGVEALTASERRVAEMASEGLTNRDIAQALFVTEKTVEGHLGHAYRKLDITSRADLPKALIRQAATPGTAPPP
jgi:DNA-binding CsgD family transcriptional regulator